MNVTIGSGANRPGNGGIVFEIQTRPFSEWAPKLLESTKDVLIATFQPWLLAGRLAWLIILAGITVEGLLAARLWAQLTNQTIETWLMRSVFTASDFLIQPFKELEPSQPIRLTGVLEFSTLVAMEAYLVAILGSLLSLFLLSKLVNLAILLVTLPSSPSLAEEPKPAPAPEVTEVSRVA